MGTHTRRPGHSRAATTRRGVAGRLNRSPSVAAWDRVSPPPSGHHEAGPERGTQKGGKAVSRRRVDTPAVVIDVGINRVEGAALEGLLAEDPSLNPRYERNRGKGIHSVLVGDVQWSGVSAVASAATPVPGGVGPLTIALLMKNTVQAAGVLSGK